LLEQKTQTNPLWVPQQGLVFVKNNDVIYGVPGFDIIYVETLQGSAEGVTGTSQ
jgi:hypothetical protein